MGHSTFRYPGKLTKPYDKITESRKDREQYKRYLEMDRERFLRATGLERHI